MENISPKEWLISIVVVIFTFCIGILINPYITDSMFDNIRIMQQALQIDNDSNQFQYAHQTNIGNVLAYGEMKALSPVGFPELINKYALVEKITEKYTQHTRQVCNGYDKDGDCTGYRTEIYYEWDTYRRDVNVSSSFDFLGVELSNLYLDTQYFVELSAQTVSPEYLSRVSWGRLYQDNDFWSSEGDLRYYYKYLPTTFKATTFIRFLDNKMYNPNSPNELIQVFYEKNRNESIVDLQSKIKTFNILYYLGLIILIVGGYFIWAYNFVEIE